VQLVIRPTKLLHHIGMPLHLGAVTVSRENRFGIALRPQMQFGIENSYVDVRAGIGDLRDGAYIGLNAAVQVPYQADERSRPRLIDSIQKSTIAPAHVQTIIAVVNAALDNLVPRTSPLRKADNSYSGTRLRAKWFTGLSKGMSAHLKPGWSDHEGYKMMGASLNAFVGEVTGFGGKHKAAESYKYIFGLGVLWPGQEVELIVGDPEEDVRSSLVAAPATSRTGAPASLSTPHAASPHTTYAGASNFPAAAAPYPQ